MHPSSNLLYAFGHKVITILGKVESDRVQKFIEAPFDYLFHVDLATNPVLDFIVAKSQAKCRVGHFDAMRNRLFEVMVKVSRTIPMEDLKRLTSQMLHYTGCMDQ